MEIPVIDRSLISIITIIDPSTGDKKFYTALWDTGAQETAITEKVAEEMRLILTDNTIKISGLDDSRSHRNRCYAGINVGVGSSKRIQPIVIPTRSDSVFDVLVGMDVIETLSSFSISNRILTIE